MKILITERQLRLLVENVTLDTILSKLKIRDTIQFSVGKVSGEPFKYIFKVVEDAGDSWKMINMNVGSTNTGFDFYLDKNAKISNSQLPMIKVSQKKGGQSDGTIKNIVSVKLGKNILYVAKTGAEVSKNDVKQSYDIAIQNLKNSKPEMDPEVANDAALAIVKQEFGDIPFAEIIDTANYGKINKDGKGGNINPEDTDYIDVSDLDASINAFKKQFKAGEGVRFTLKEDDSLSVINFNVLSVSGNTANIKLIETDSSEYNKYRKAEFIMNFDRSYIEINGKTIDIKLLIADTDGNKIIKNVVKINATQENNDEVKVDKEMFLKYIQSDPVLMNAFAKTPTLMGLINVGDVRGLSKAYELLDKSGFDFDGSKSDDIKSGNFSDNFSSNYSSKIRLLKDVNFFEGEKIVAGDKVVRVKRSKNTVILTDTDGNTYKILKDLSGDIYEVNAQRKQDTSGIKVKIKVLDYKTQN